MLSFLPSFILLPFSFTLFCLNLAFAGSLITLGGLFKWLIPHQGFQTLLLAFMHVIFRLWARNNFLIIRLCNKVSVTITGDEGLSKNHWYLLIANHQSWLDIMVLAEFARTRIPEPKFFLKDSLKKVPFLGMGCWALNMPFMKRYSREQIQKHPELKGQDIETTKKSCQYFRDYPTTIINFVEGTRFSEQKQQSQPLPFQHLLMPKAAGIAFTLAAMENKFDKILDVSIIYPDMSKEIMKDTLKGKLKNVHIHINQIAVTEEIIGDYFNDSTFKSFFQTWLNNLWQKKDLFITNYLK